MKFVPLDIQGAILAIPDIHGDARGAFWESYRKDLFSSQGIPEEFVQDNQSISSKGALRGLHWQVAPAAQSKLVRCVSGEVFDVIVDVRLQSKTFGVWFGEILSSENRKMLYVPVGCAHGFLTLSGQAEVAYKVSSFYSPENERGLHWNDPEVAIQWPEFEGELIISERDQKHPGLSSLKDQAHK